MFKNYEAHNCVIFYIHLFFPPSHSQISSTQLYFLVVEWDQVLHQCGKKREKRKKERKEEKKNEPKFLTDSEAKNFDNMDNEIGLQALNSVLK
jgi:hypothetical protein